MGDLVYYRVPKTTLGASMPLRAMIEVVPKKEQEWTRWVDVSLYRWDEHWPESPPVYQRKLKDAFSPRPGCYLLDEPLLVGPPEGLGVTPLPPGAYRMTIYDGEEKHDVDEMLWLMDDDEYLCRAREIASEPFEPARALDTREVIAFVKQLLDQELRPDRFYQDEGGNVSISDCPLNVFQHEGVAGKLYPDSAVRWTVNNIASAFRYLAFFGVSHAVWSMTLTASHISLKVSAKIFQPHHVYLSDVSESEERAWKAVTVDLDVFKSADPTNVFDFQLSPRSLDKLELELKFALDEIPLK